MLKCIISGLEHLLATNDDQVNHGLFTNKNRLTDLDHVVYSGCAIAYLVRTVHFSGRFMAEYKENPVNKIPVDAIGMQVN